MKCTKKGTHLVDFNFTNMVFTHKGGIPLVVVVEDVTNPRSSRPTDSFSDMLFTSLDSFKISEYT